MELIGDLRNASNHKLPDCSMQMLTAAQWLADRNLCWQLVYKLRHPGNHTTALCRDLMLEAANEIEQALREQAESEAE